MNIKRFLKKAARILTMSCVMAMFLVFGAVNLPRNPSQSNATVGKDYFLYVNIGTVETPVWALIGGQRGSSLGRTADSIDVSHKTSGGWKTMKAGMRGWSIDLDGLVILGDEGLDALETAFDEGIEVHLKFEYPDGSYRDGWAAITDFSFETPHDGEASLSGSLEGNGPLSALKLPNVITPTTATFSKASPTAKVFTIAPAVGVTAVKNGSTALSATTDYTYATGTLTILSAYLEDLTNGNVTINIETETGNDLSVVITVTA